MIGLMTDHRHGSWMLCSCALGSTLLAGWAMAQPPAVPPQRAERPEPAVMQVTPVDPKLDALLKEWERKTAGIKTLHGEHFRREYNDVFQVQKQSEGEFYFESPDKGRIDIRGIPPKSNQVANKKNPQNGQPFKLEAGLDQTWICNGKEIVVVDPPQKQFERMPIPPEMQGNNIIRSPLPFLFGMKAEDAKRRFQMTIVDEKPEYWLLDVVPRSKVDGQNYSQARVFLDKETYVPFAVRLVDPAGSGTTEYLFYREKLKINQPGFLVAVGAKDWFNPRLPGYKEIQAPNGGVQPAGNLQPAGQQKLATPKPAATSQAPSSKNTKSALLPR
jgi:TIGR03009 family protein